MATVNHGVLRMELAVGKLVGLGHAAHLFDDVHRLEQKRVDLRRIADDADDGLVLALADVGTVAPSLDPAYEVLQLFGGC